MPSTQMAPLSPEEELVTKAFIKRVNDARQERNGGPISWNTAVKFMMARKFSLERALLLYQLHENTRAREGLVNFDPTKDPLRKELETQKFTILPKRDSSGAAIAVFTAHLHDPSLSSHVTTLQGIVYQLDVALESTETQRSGLIFIYDMTDSKYANFDYDLSQKILTLLKGAYPARLKKVLIVTAPLWFKAPFKILRLFVREKLRDRVYTVSTPQLWSHIPIDSLPKELGGKLEVNHTGWLIECLQSVTYQGSDFTDFSADLLLTTPGKNHSSSWADVSHSQGSSEEGQPSVEGSQGSDDGLSSRKKSFDKKLSGLVLPNGHPHSTPSLASEGSEDESSASLPSEYSHPMNMEQLLEHVKSHGKAGLYAEYAELKSSSLFGSFEVSRSRPNVCKNRYTDVLCYDHSRVVLEKQEADPHSDYINANFVNGYKQEKAFIFTQGPLPRTFSDFWHMIWEQQGGETREVIHLQFTSWPDYGVPQSAAAMLGFLAHIRSQRAHSIQMPDQYVFCYMALLEHAITVGLLSPDSLENLDGDHTDSD
ncbi:unnamed protein product [Darwinula stevensoni]|uniref:Tyrosine-protein phosphatase non-receptor type 9 n=1 Tax=Darwinula stevensoni TaxID=69355 RepID=A0A7R8X3F9_9CRUS|nr:unnamed protein product [Darwinula stevensoni]CAG0884932.1 unnamed protein product [Darwinula stevensoni]